MKIIEKLAKKFTRSASSTVKTEVKKTAIDLLPALATVATEDLSPTVRNTHVTTNNYFFKELSEESIKKILED